jgi:hypothetical protein
MALESLNDGNFNAAINPGFPVLVLVTEPNPFEDTQILPFIQRLVERYDEAMAAYTFDPADGLRTTALLRLRHAPIVLMFKEGKEEWREKVWQRDIEAILQRSIKETLWITALNSQDTWRVPT